MFPQRSTYRPTDGLGAYFAPKYETPISGLGSSGGCGCGKPVSGVRGVRGVGAIIGDDSSYPSPVKIGLALGLAAMVVCVALKVA